MKKVAIQLAANPRSFKRCYDSFKKNIIDTLNPDIFIHTWRLHGNERPEVTTDGSCEEYIDLYKPVAYEIEDLEYNYEPLMTMVPHFTTRYRVNQIRKKYQKENNIKYDVVIMDRADIRLTNPPISYNYNQVIGSEFKREYLEKLQKDEIWVHHFKDGLPADYFFYSSPEWMDISIEGCYNNIDKLHLYNPGSERLWWHILQENGFKKEWFKYFGNSIHDQDHIDNSFKFFDIECIR
jgi:hypothetical protein